MYIQHNTEPNPKYFDEQRDKTKHAKKKKIKTKKPYLKSNLKYYAAESKTQY